MAAAIPQKAFIAHLKPLISSLLSFLLCLFAHTGKAQSTTPPPQYDTQFWNETHLFAPINPKLDVLLSGFLRIGRNLHRPVDERIGGGIAYRPNRHVTLQPHYLYVAQQPFAGRKIIEHRLNAEATFRVFPGKFVIADRNRLERRVRSASRDFWVYRNRIQIDHPARIGRFTFRPFIADEFWYDTLQRAWTRNRISAGIIKDLGKHVQAEVFYLRQNDGRARPGDLHVIGALLRIRP